MATLKAEQDKAEAEAKRLQALKEKADAIVAQGGVVVQVVDEAGNVLDVVDGTKSTKNTDGTISVDGQAYTVNANGTISKVVTPASNTVTPSSNTVTPSSNTVTPASKAVVTPTNVVSAPGTASKFVATNYAKGFVSPADKDKALPETGESVQSAWAKLGVVILSAATLGFAFKRKEN